jgi:glycosyltransferase involved in cell wall biosynthesis
MKIAIDARWIFPKISGVGTYTLELLREIATLDRSHHFTLVFNDPEIRDRVTADLCLDPAPHFATALLPYGLFSIRNQVLLPLWLHREGFDIYHSTNYLIPLLAFPVSRRGRTHSVATIHDVIPLAIPDHAPKSRKSRMFPLYKRLMIEVGARAQTIITVSHSSRRDIIQHLRIPRVSADKVHVIYNGVSTVFRPPTRHRPDAEYPARTRRLLYVGRMDPYKNVTGLVRILAAVRARSAVPVELVIAGANDPRYPEAMILARELGVSQHIQWTGYLPTDRLLSVYQQADCLVHPSRYEGFGLQIAEAMACGLPVVSSNAASLPEVAGDAAILLPPDDVQGFADHVLRVLTDPALAQSLTARGIAQATKFSWKTAATETLALYSRAAPAT